MPTPKTIVDTEPLIVAGMSARLNWKLGGARAHLPRYDGGRHWDTALLYF
jgi:hypothetical protein